MNQIVNFEIKPEYYKQIHNVLSVVSDEHRLSLISNGDIND